MRLSGYLYKCKFVQRISKVGENLYDYRGACIALSIPHFELEDISPSKF